MASRSIWYLTLWSASRDAVKSSSKITRNKRPSLRRDASACTAEMSRYAKR